MAAARLTLLRLADPPGQEHDGDLPLLELAGG